MKKKRVIWVDLLNIVACFCVVWMHCTNDAVHHFTGEISSPYIIGVITHTVAYWPVPVFIMLSGYNLIAYHGNWSKFYKKRWRKTVVPFLLWSLFYCIFNYHRGLPLKDFIELLINGRFCGTMWFFIPLFSIYLCMPVLNLFVKNASIRQLRAYLLVGFIFISLIPCILDFSKISYTDMFPVGSNFLLIAVAGYVIPHDRWFETHKTLFYICGAFALILHGALLFCITYIWGEQSRSFLNCIYPTNILITISVYLFFYTNDWYAILKKIRVTPSAVQYISSCSFGIYLVHPFYRSLVEYFHINGFMPYVGVFILYIVSFITVSLMKRIPLLRIMVP